MLISACVGTRGKVVFQSLANLFCDERFNIVTGRFRAARALNETPNRRSKGNEDADDNTNDSDKDGR